MHVITFTVTGMSCMGCVNSVKNLLMAVPGVSRVEVNLQSGQVRVECTSEQVDAEALKQVVVDGGYGIAV